ncbi:MAG: tol-pal system protein YbgF [Hyphomonadaceae bacterium]
MRRRRARAIAATQPAQRLVFLSYFLLAAAALALCALMAPRADAQVFSSQPYVAAPDPAVEQLRVRVEALEADLKRAIDRAESLGAALGDARRIAEDADTGRRRAEAEIEALKSRVEALEDRLTDAGVAPAQDASAGGAISLTPAGPSAAVDVAALPEDESALFDHAKALLLNEGNFPGAQAAFGAFLTKYPKSQQAGDAQYYLGESLLYQDNFTDAAAAYGKLIKDYPKSANAPTGLVKLARSLRLLGNNAQACRTLALMSQNFPKAPAVAKQLASQERQQAKCS